MDFKLLNQLNKKQINQLSIFLNDVDNMKRFIGKTFTNEKLKNMISFAKEDFKNEFKNIKYLYVVLLLNKDVIGIGVTMPYYLDTSINRLNVSVDTKYLDNGYENELIDVLLDLHYKFIKNTPLISIVEKNNKYYNKIFKKFEIKKKIKINNKKLNVYQLL